MRIRHLISARAYEPNWSTGSFMPNHPALTGKSIFVGAYTDNELYENGTVTKSSPGAMYIYKDNTMLKLFPNTILAPGTRLRFGGVHFGQTAAAVNSSKIYVGSQQGPYSFDFDGSNEHHFNMQDASLYSGTHRQKWMNGQFAEHAIAANDSYVAFSGIGANNLYGSIAIFDNQNNHLYDIDSPYYNQSWGERLVMLPNNRLLVGSRTHDWNGNSVPNSGAIYIYSLSNSSYSQVGTGMFGTQYQDQYGASLASNGSLIVGGNPYATSRVSGNGYEGFVSVYNSSLVHQFDIDAPDELGSYANFGTAVAIGSDKIAVSDNVNNINKVWFYDLSGNPIGEIEGPPNSAFGSAPMSVQISGSGSTQAIFITATSGDGEGLNFGDVWIYDQNLSLIGRLSGFDRGSFGTFVLVS